MQAPLSPENRPSSGQGQEKSIKKENPSIKRVHKAVQPALRLKMEETTKELIQARPFLASLIREENLEDNFFRLTDTIYFLAKLLKIPLPIKGPDQLLELARQLPSQLDLDKVPTKDLSSTWPLVINVIDCLPPAKQKAALTNLLRKVQAKPNFEAVEQIVRRLSTSQDVAAFAKLQKEPKRTALYLQVIHELLKKGDVQAAKAHIDQIDLKFPGPLPFLITAPVSLEAILYYASKLPSEREAFLKAAAYLLKNIHQDHLMIEIYKLLKPGDGRDMFLTTQIQSYLHVIDEQNLWIVEELLNLISKEGLKTIVQQKMKAHYFKQKIR